MHVPPAFPATQSSITPLAEPPLSVAAARDRVAEWKDLSRTRLRDLASALSTAASMDGRSPGEVMLTPAGLRAKMLDRSPTAYGITKGTWRSKLSGVRYVMRRLDIIDRADAPLTPAWEAELGRLKPLRRAGLIALARFCSAHDIRPDADPVPMFDAFETHLVTRTLVSRPAKTVGQVRGAWNHACAHAAGWAGQPLAPRHRGSHYVLPLHAFPAGFQAGLLVLGQQMGATVLDDLDDDDDDDRPLSQTATLRPSTIALRLSHARWAASAQVASGVPISEYTSLASLVTPLQRAKVGLRYLRDRAGGKPSAAGTHVAEVLCIIGKHVGLPPGQIAKIKRWGKPVALSYRGMTEHNERCVKEMMQPHRLERLLQLPEALMQAARRLHDSAPDQARSLALRAVSIGFLTRLPVRLANLTGLRLDRHFHRPELKRGLISHLLIPAEDTKNKRPISLPVSRATAQLIEEWITDYRAPSVPGCTYLFPGLGTGNRPITHQGMRDAIKGAMRTYVGANLSPHQFRHFAARLFLDAYPGHYEEVRQLLGHGSVTTTTRHYSGIEDEATARRYDEDVLGGHARSHAGRGQPAPGRPRSSRPGRR